MWLSHHCQRHQFTVQRGYKCMLSHNSQTVCSVCHLSRPLVNLTRPPRGHAPSLRKPAPKRCGPFFVHSEIGFRSTRYVCGFLIADWKHVCQVLKCSMVMHVKNVHVVMLRKVHCEYDTLKTDLLPNKNFHDIANGFDYSKQSLKFSLNENS